MLKDTIVALAGNTPSAIALIRLSGKEAKEITNKILKKSISGLKSYNLSHNYIMDNNQIVDEVIVAYFKEPNSYTGEDVVEISIHGSSYLANKISELIIIKGARLANPGEFTQRAFLNGKLDLTQAEAINDLINSTTAYNAKKAIEGIQGKVSDLLDPLQQELQKVISLIEVNIDYPEYDETAKLSGEIILPQIKECQKETEKIIKEAKNNLLLKDGILTVIIGEPNVGKSSLLNTLVSKDRALVSKQAGTTRDYIEEEIVIDQIHLRLIDTAGLRDSLDSLEKAGIEKTKDLIKSAQLVILVLDASKEISNEELELIKSLKKQETIIVANKSDLNPCYPLGIKISALNQDIEELIKEIKTRYDSEKLLQTSTLSSARQLGLMELADSSLKAAITGLENGLELELVAIDLNLAYQHLKDISGKYNRMDILESIFKDFCLGK